MSVLTSASGTSVSRGYDYYQDNNVSKVNQLNDYEFEGYVKGNLKNEYYVKINIKQPRKSYCDCPHANGNITCKHMVALYFAIFPEEVEDYEAWLDSDFDEEENDYDEYDYGEYEDDEYDDYDNTSTFEKHLFFDKVVEQYVNELTVPQLRQVLITELKNDEKRAFELYIGKYYKQYLTKSNDAFVFLEKINKKVQELTGYYNYNYNNFDAVILTINQRKKIEEFYKDKSLRSSIDKLLFNAKLAVYSDYEWIAKFYKKNKSVAEIEQYCQILENYLNSLKHYSIKNLEPKSNILIMIHLLNDFTIAEIAKSLLKNAKYLQYVKYVIKNTKNTLELYSEFMKLIRKDYIRNKMYIPEVLFNFARKTDYANEEIVRNHYFYSYLCLGRTEYLRYLSFHLSNKEITNFIENNTKNTILLANLYSFYEEVDKLWNILKNSNYNYMLLDNIEILKTKYNDELYNYFTNQFYTTLKKGKNREVYYEASQYLVAISKLDNGNEFTSKIISDLKKSEYKKCSILFEEINKALQN